MEKNFKNLNNKEEYKIEDAAEEASQMQEYLKRWSAKDESEKQDYDMAGKIAEREIEKGKAIATPENPSLNLLTNLEETFRAMGEVEGAGWLADQEYLRNNPELHKSNSVWGVLDAIKKGGSGSQTIYGDGGFTRWYVNANGSLRLDKSDDKQKTIKAMKLGFKIHPDRNL